MRKIKWCIIGAGGIADRRAIPALLKNNNNEIVAIMDKNPDTAKSVAYKYGFETYFTDEEKMLKEVSCDAVYIGTPVFCHYRQALLALKYGANVFIEKPIAMNEKEATEITNAFKSAGKQITVGYMMSYHNLHQKARKLISEKKLGDIHLIKMQFSCWYPEIDGAWRQNKKLGGGGCIMDLAVHCIELLSSITDDKIEKIKAFYTTKTFSYEVEDSAVITFKTNKGILGHIDVNFNIPDKCASSKLEIYGTSGCIIAEGTLGQEEKGKLKFISSPQNEYEASQIRITSKPKIYYGKGSDIYTKQFNAFNKLLLTNKHDYTNAINALHIQGICDKIYSENCY